MIRTVFAASALAALGACTSLVHHPSAKATTSTTLCPVQVKAAAARTQTAFEEAITRANMVTGTETTSQALARVTKVKQMRADETLAIQAITSVC